MCTEGEININTSYALTEAKKYEKMCLENPQLLKIRVDKSELEKIMLTITYNDEFKAGFLECGINTYSDLIGKLNEYARHYHM